MCGLPDNAKNLLYLVIEPNIKAAVLTFSRLRLWLNDLRLLRHRKNCFGKNSLLTLPAIPAGQHIAPSYPRHKESLISASVYLRRRSRIWPKILAGQIMKPDGDRHREWPRASRSCRKKSSK